MHDPRASVLDMVLAIDRARDLVADDMGQDVARAQNAEVENDLPEWSRAFPSVTFAFIEADCFGGYCEYSGYCCRDGEVSNRRSRESGGSLEALAAGVGLEIASPFAPFVRGFFTGRCSGGPYE